MKVPRILLAGLVAVGLTGCGLAAGHSPADSPPAAQRQTGSSRPQQGGTQAQPAPKHAQTGTSRASSARAQAPSTAGQDGSAGTATPAGARAAAAHFYSLYEASRFAEAWDLLAPSARHHIPRNIWTKVHTGCLPARGGAQARVIGSVTVFGHTAIISQRLAGVHGTHHAARDIFSYGRSGWAYSPDDLAVYQHESVAADIAAAKAAGLCASGNPATL
jgi:hypothetical protein